MDLDGYIRAAFFLLFSKVMNCPSAILLRPLLTDVLGAKTSLLLKEKAVVGKVLGLHPHSYYYSISSDNSPLFSLPLFTAYDRVILASCAILFIDMPSIDLSVALYMTVFACMSISNTANICI